MSLYRLLPLVLLAYSLASPAAAQINPFRGSRAAPLTPEDSAALLDATTHLLERPQLAAGQTETWSNPSSGASGTLTAGRASHRKGLACRPITYRNTIPGPTSQRNTTLTWCKTKDGWKTAG